MITNNQQHQSRDYLSQTNIEVPSGNPNWQAPPMIQPTPYHYLALLPTIIAAATPLILGLVRQSKSSTNPQPTKKQGRKQAKENSDDVAEN